MSKLATIKAVQTLLGTPCLPTSQLRHALEFSPFHLLQFRTWRQHNLSGTLCVATRTAADGETAGRNINNFTEITNCEGKPGKFCSVPCDFQHRDFCS